MHAISRAGARFVRRSTLVLILALTAACLSLSSGGCPGNEPVDLSNPLGLQGGDLLGDDIDPVDGGIGEPVVLDHEVATIQNQPVTVSLSAAELSDVDCSFSVVAEPATGSISQVRSLDQNTAEVTYTPEENFVGQAQFSYQVSAGAVHSNVGTVIITVYPEVRFDVEIIAEEPYLTVRAYAFTRTGEGLPEGAYAWRFDEQEESGPVATHSAREYAFTHGGSHVITLTLTLAGLATPISCSTGDTGTDKEHHVSSFDQGGVLTVSLGDDFESTGPQGGPFNPGSMTYILSNTGAEPIDWSASKMRNWVSLSNADGTLAPGETTEVVVSINDNANDLDAGTHSDTVKFANETNGAGDTTRDVSLTVIAGSDACETSSTVWQNFAFDSEQSGVFTAEFDVTPSADNMDGLIALSAGAGDAFSDYAVQVRFNPAGILDVRDGGAYRADTTIAYAVGTAYHFRLVVNVPARTYSVYVDEPPNEQTLATDYAFRTEQGTVGVLDHWGLWAAVSGSHQVCSFAIASTGNQPPVAEAGPYQNVDDPDESGDELVTLDGSGSFDADGTIVNYRWTEGETVLYDGPAPTVTVTLAQGHHLIPLEVTDNDGGEGHDDVLIDVAISSLTQWGITWTFDRPYQVGQFVNGDWWVCPDTPDGTVTVVSVNPAPTGSGGNFRNGSMVNPIPGQAVHGQGQAFDGRALSFNESLAVQFPYALQAGQSLVSAKSRSDTPSDQKLQTATVLTCLGGSVEGGRYFRPPFTGTEKPLFDATTIREDLLSNLDPASDAPDPQGLYATKFQRCWPDIVSGWQGNRIFPIDNMSPYGREISDDVGDAVLLACCDPGQIGDKSDLVRGIVQVGIDLFYLLENGQGWAPDGGCSSGRKLPILFAGLMLENDDMLGIGTACPARTFGEDGQTFYVSQEDVDRVLNIEVTGPVLSATATTVVVQGTDDSYEAYVMGNDIEITGGTGAGQRRYCVAYDTDTKVITVETPWDIIPDATSTYAIVGYETTDIGLAEWGIRHATLPVYDNPSWFQPYRRCCTTRTWEGEMLGALILGLRPAWNHDAFFDYVDRYVTVTAPDGDHPGWHPNGFGIAMWNLYRSDY